MAKTKSLMKRVANNTGRKKMGGQPRMTQSTQESSIVRYNGVTGVARSNDGYMVLGRTYIPGLKQMTNLGTPANLNFCGPVTSSGINIVGAYSTAKFLAGTKAEWTPNVGFTTNGRIYFGYTDNPEVIAAMNQAAQNYLAAPTGPGAVTYGNLVKSLGNVQTFQIFERFTTMLPTRLRRKRFSTDVICDGVGEDVLEKSCQQGFFAFGEGLPDGSVGSFLFTDIVDVEGIRNVNLT